MIPTSQQEVLDQVIAAAQASDHRQPIGVFGLSGVGKSHLLQQLPPAPELNGYKAVSFDDLPRNAEGGKKVRGKIIVDLPLNKASAAHESFLLKGLFANELAHILQEKNLEPSGYTLEELSTACLGIPLVAERAIQFGMTMPEIESAVVHHLIHHRPPRCVTTTRIKQWASDFLNIEVPYQIAARIHELCVDDHYIIGSYIWNAFNEIVREGSRETPFFMVPETEQVYGREPLPNRQSSMIELFVPGLSEKDFIHIRDQIGWRDGSQPAFGRLEPGKGQSNRAKRFCADYRKASVYLVDEHGNVFENHSEYAEHHHDLAVKTIGLYSDGLPGMEAAQEELGRMIHLIKDEHHYVIEDVNRFGIAFETLFQQIGVPYLCINHIVGTSYVFDPVSNSLRFLSE